MVVIWTCNIDFFVNCTGPLQQKKSWKKQSTSTQQYDIYPLSQASDKDSIKMELLRQFYEENQNVLYLSFYSFISSAIIFKSNECNLQLNAMQWFENAILLCFCYVCASSSVFRSDWEAKTWRDQGCTSSRDRSRGWDDYQVRFILLLRFTTTI